MNGPMTTLYAALRAPSLRALCLAGLAGCSSVAHRDPVDLEAWRLLTRGQAELALAEFDRVEADALDDTARARQNLGRSRALAALGRTEAATAAVEQTIKHAPSASQGYVDLGVLQLERGDPARALVAFGQALELDPNHAIASFDRGLALFQLGSLPQAREAFARAIELDPNLGPAYNAQGVLLAKDGDLADAELSLIHI